MDGEIKPKNSVLVIIIGPPKSGKSQLAADISTILKERVEVENVRVMTTNDYDAFAQVQRISDKAMVES